MSKAQLTTNVSRHQSEHIRTEPKKLTQHKKLIQLHMSQK